MCDMQIGERAASGRRMSSQQRSEPALPWWSRWIYRIAVILGLLSLVGCGGVGDGVSEPASLWVIQPDSGVLVVTAQGNIGDTTVTAPACLRWSDLHVTPTILWSYNGSPFTAAWTTPLWPEELPNAIAGLF